MHICATDGALQEPLRRWNYVQGPGVTSRGFVPDICLTAVRRRSALDEREGGGAGEREGAAGESATASREPRESRDASVRMRRARDRVASLGDGGPVPLLYGPRRPLRFTSWIFLCQAFFKFSPSRPDSTLLHRLLVLALR